MANKARGEQTVKVNGKEYTLCMTLGALADLEDNLNIKSIDKLGEKFSSQPRAKDIIILLTALARGGGHDDITDSTFRNVTIPEMKEIMSKIQGVMGAATEDEKPVKKRKA